MITLLGLRFTSVELIITCGLAIAIVLALVILAKLPKKRVAEPRAFEAASVPVAPAGSADEDEALIAVLAAAVAAATGMQPDAFHITSYRPVEGRRQRSAWSKAGRIEQMSRTY